MASVKVAVRVRPFNQRERDMQSKLIVEMEGKKTRLLPAKSSKDDIIRERYKDFTFDHSYWSYDDKDKHYASQEQVFADLGLDVIDSAFEGYNACVFAYGQTGSGKTFTMMGSPECQGLIPRICRSLFARVTAGKEKGSSYRTEVSYLEIYNERVKDLLSGDMGHSLRVREHPKLGPYVQDLSKHLVSDYDDIQECMHRGNLQRTTASTQMNDVSSRSHAIFTVTFVQARYLQHNNMPSETVSKVHLVDLAGSERADATGATGQRLVEGAHINKSLVTLGSVISALAESSALQNGPKANSKTTKNVFIPYRDSVLTWLLKDSLGGNSKTIMIAAISPADCNYGETLSTLRYANRAKNIINKPTINEDSNVKLIRELREEIDKLRAQIGRSADSIEAESAHVLATLQLKEAQEKVLTEKWTEKWRETQQILQEQKALGLRKSGLGVVLDSDMPHLVGIDDNLLSTGVTLYHLKEGSTLIGSEECSGVPDIVLTGAGVLPEHCRITLCEGTATIHPDPAAQCWLNTVLIDKPTKLSQGCILLLGRTNMFRYNDPAEAAKLRREGSASVMNLSRLSLLSCSTVDLNASTENLNATLGDTDWGDIRERNPSEAIEAQRLELMKDREAFQQQQEERQRKWHQEKEQLEEAQKKLDEERQQMEREYAAACRRLSGDWRALERGWGSKRRALRQRQQELSGRRRRLRGLSDTHQQMVDNESTRVSSLRTEIEEKQKGLDKVVRDSIKHLVSQGVHLGPSSSPSPDDSVLSENPRQHLMLLLQQSDSEAAGVIRDLVSRHKKDLNQLECELQTRVASLASHRAKVEQLESELALLTTQEVGLERTLLNAEIPPSDKMTQSAEMTSEHRRQGEFSPVRVTRSKSELTLFQGGGGDVDNVLDNGEKIEEDLENIRQKKMSMSLNLEHDPRHSVSAIADETFHTANSDCSVFSQLFPAISSETLSPTIPDDSLRLDGSLTPTTNPDDSLRMDTSSKMTGEIPAAIDIGKDSEQSENGVSSGMSVNFKLGPMPRMDDSDEMSSTEDYSKSHLIAGQSTSIFDRTPDERHQRSKFKRRFGGDGRARRVTEAEALRAMQRLCQRVAAQKMLVISSLENDCSKEDLNNQIAVLQELQKRYVRLEMALQYSFFDNQTSSRSRNIMVTPIQEMNSLTLSESDMQITQDTDSNSNVETCNANNSSSAQDPLIQRLKDGELEASDNVSTSNDELATGDAEVNDNNRLWSDRCDASEGYVRDPLRFHGSAGSGSRKSSVDSSPRTSNSYHSGRRRTLDTECSGSLMTYPAAGLTHPIDFEQCVWIPSFVVRGAGKSTHHEYEVRLQLPGERWVLLRRYRRFRELYINMKVLYGAKVASIPFPSRQLWSTEGLARTRRPQLETFLRRLLNVCSVDKRCPFHARPLTKETLIQFSPFFRKGVFESGKCGTG